LQFFEYRLRSVLLGALARGASALGARILDDAFNLE
jgi:hypothetical protein